MRRLGPILLYSLVRILFVAVPFALIALGLWQFGPLVAVSLGALFAVLIGAALSVIVLGRFEDPLAAWLAERRAGRQRRTAADDDAELEDAAADATRAAGDRRDQNGDVTNT